MTNAELLAKIKAEIERRITDNTFGAKLELIDIIAWLDTLESEHLADARKTSPKDLESYAQRVEDYYDVGEERGYLCTHRGDIKDAVIAGAKWQKGQDRLEIANIKAKLWQDGFDDCKEQMMKEAVEATLDNTAYPTRLWFNTYLSEYSNNDKVRIIIVKEN